MNVLYITHRGVMGGGEYSLLDIIREMDCRRVCRYVLAPREGPFAASARSLGVPVETADFPPVRKFSLAPIRCISRLIREYAIDIIHCNTTRAVMYAMGPAKLHNVKIVWHNRGTDSRGFIEWLLALGADRLIAISHSVARLLYRQGIRKNKIVMIYNGISLNPAPDVSRDMLRKEYNIPATTALIGLIGRFTREKGHQYIVDVLPELRRQLKRDIKVIFIGDDNFGESTRNAVTALSKKRNCDQDIIFAGYRDNIQQLIPGLDVVVIPSEREAFGRVVLESWLAGVSVAAFAVEGLAELITHGETGLLADPGSTQGLCDILRRLLGDPAYSRRLALNGREEVEKYDITHKIPELLHLYYSLPV